MSRIEISGLSVAYGQQPVLHDIDLDVLRQLINT